MGGKGHGSLAPLRVSDVCADTESRTVFQGILGLLPITKLKNLLSAFRRLRTSIRGATAEMLDAVDQIIVAALKRRAMRAVAAGA